MVARNVEDKRKVWGENDAGFSKLPILLSDSRLSYLIMVKAHEDDH